MKIEKGDLLVMTGAGKIEPEGDDWIEVKQRWRIRLWRWITRQEPTFCYWKTIDSVHDGPGPDA